MVKIAFESYFEKIISKIKDENLKEKLKKQMQKVIDSPEVGKPMRFGRKGTREVYVPPFRLSYIYIKDEDKIILLDLFHKDQQ